MSGISISLSGNFSALDTLKNKALDVSKSISRGFQERIGQRMFDGLLQAASQIGPAIQDALVAGGELSDMVARTGAAGEGLVILQQAFANTGMSADQVAPQINRMQKALAGLNEDGEPTNKAFERLKLSVGELSAMDPAKAFAKIATTIAAIKDPAERSARAMEIFGRSGAELLVLFTDPAAFQVAQRQLGSLPQTLTQNMGAFDAAADNLTLMQVKLRELGVEIASALLPQIQSLTEWTNDLSLREIGESIGSVAASVAKILPYLDEVAVALAAIKLVGWAEAIAAAGASLTAMGAGAGIAAGGLSALGPAIGAAAAAMGPYLLAIGAAVAGYKALTWYLDRMKEKNDAIGASLNRGNEAVKKFNVTELQQSLATRDEIAAKIEEIQKEKDAVREAADRQMSELGAGEAADAVAKDTELTIGFLDLMIKKLNKTTDAQLAANQAKRDAVAAEAEHADAIKKSADAYEQARKNYESKLAGAEARRVDQLDVSGLDQEIEKKRNQLSFSEFVQPGDSTGQIAEVIAASGDYADKGQDMETLNQIVDLERKRAELIAKNERDQAAAQARLDEANAAYAEELGLLDAQLSGNAPKLRQLQQEAEMRREIANMVAAGVDAKLAEQRAADLVNRKNAIGLADQRSRVAAMQEEADAMIAGEQAVAELAARRRAKELQDQTGMGKIEADQIAQREQAFERLQGLISDRDSLRFESGVGAVSSMQRFGGGGGAVSTGMDYARRQSDLQAQILAELTAVRGVLRAPSLFD